MEDDRVSQRVFEEFWLQERAGAGGEVVVMVVVCTDGGERQWVMHVQSWYRWIVVMIRCM